MQMRKMDFIKSNFTFILATFATTISLIWFIAQPDFEPAITTTLGILTCVGLRPKDWKVIIKRNISELPDWNVERISVESGVKRENTLTEKAGYKRFNYEYAFESRDKSLEFTIKAPESKFGDMELIPIRVLMMTKINSYGLTQFYVYSIIPDRIPTCIFQFDGSCGEIYAEDIDKNGIPELIVGYKCGAHTECMKIFKLDRNYDFTAVEGSDVCGDLSLITWEFKNNDFLVKTYNRNYGMDREAWHSLVESYLFTDNRFELIKSEKVKYIEETTKVSSCYASNSNKP